MAGDTVCPAFALLIEYRSGLASTGTNFVYPEPPLFVIAPVQDGVDLKQLPWCPAARDRIFVNHAKFENLELAEVLVDAMPFLLSRLTATEMRQQNPALQDDLLSGAQLSSADHTIGVAPGDNLTSARHLPEIIGRLLLLGLWIGESLDAKAAAWPPSGKVASFAGFGESVHHYLAGGPLPALCQPALAEMATAR